MNVIVNRKEFLDWLKKNYDLSELTYPTIVSDSFLIFRENLGITFLEIVEETKSLDDYQRAVESWLIKNGKVVRQRPSEYTSHIKYLIAFAKQKDITIHQTKLNLCNINKTDFETWLRNNYTFKEPTYKTILSTSFFICRYNLGVSLDDILQKRKTIEDFRQAIQSWLDDNPNNHASKSIDYVYHLRFLLEYLQIQPLNFDNLAKISNFKEIKRLDKKAPNVLYPTCDIVSSYLENWDNLDNYVMQENALNNLFHKAFPNNDNMSEVLIKISALNDFYSTNIFNVYAVAKHYVTQNIDYRLKNVDVSLVEDLSNIPGLKARIYSFATKYCSHHKSDDYPIYDSYVEKMLLHFRNQYGFYDFEKTDLRDFAKFKIVINNFRIFFNLDQFSAKDIDKYLWQAGKEYFPNWKKALN